MNDGGLSVLICRVGSCLCALSIGDVVETMRPLPVELVGESPPFLLGVAVIRGQVTPVVSLAALLGVAHMVSGRFVTLGIDDRFVALAVDEVLGVRELSAETVGEIPPLLHEADAGMVSAIGTSDSDLLLVLDRSSLVPDPTWALIAQGAPRP